MSSFKPTWNSPPFVRLPLLGGRKLDRARLTNIIDQYTMDVGQDGMAPMVMWLNVANLYDYLTSA